MKKRGKIYFKGQGHVEFMISFVLFITAVLLLFVYINPLGKSESNTKLQESAKDILIKKISGVVGKINVISNASPYCYGSKVLIYSNNFTEKDATPLGVTDKKVYYLYVSPYLINKSTNFISSCNDANYIVASYSDEDIILKNLTTNLKQEYETDYYTTKKNLGIINDFSFTFKYKNGSIAEEMSVNRNVSKNMDKYATEYPVRVIDNNAGISEMIINIKLW